MSMMTGIDRRLRLLKRLFVMALGIWMVQAAVARAAVQTIVQNASGQVVLGQFDDSLGIMTGANVQVLWNGATGVSTGSPNVTHTYSASAGTFNLSGVVAPAGP